MYSIVNWFYFIATKQLPVLTGWWVVLVCTVDSQQHIPGLKRKISVEIATKNICEECNRELLCQILLS